MYIKKGNLPTYIRTYHGLEFDFVDPKPEQVCIEDIAHALSNICRFTGHTPNHYSVAEHSILVSYYVEPQNRLLALLHDASEAYLGDVASPLKQLLPEYKKLEEKVANVIFEALGVDIVTNKAYNDVKLADNLMLEKEFSHIVYGEEDGEVYFPFRNYSRDNIRQLYLDYFNSYKLLQQQ
jgi:phage pi2 protein 07